MDFAEDLGVACVHGLASRAMCWEGLASDCSRNCHVWEFKFCIIGQYVEK